MNSVLMAALLELMADEVLPITTLMAKTWHANRSTREHHP
jgi:hypothetical protein